MPKKLKKPKEQKLAEDYFPVDESDLKHTTEKQEREFSPDLSHAIIEKTYKSLDRKSFEKIEKVYKKKRSKKKTKRKTNKSQKKYTTPKVELSKGGYELVITEKPQAALKIANALGKAVQKNINKVPYYEVDREGKKIIVACAVGHLFTLKQNVSGTNIPIFDISWIPNYLARKKDFTKKYYDTLLKLAKGAGSLIVATDYDVEGEVIGWNVVRFICGQKDANRMKFSTLTKEELNDAYEKKSKSIDWGQAIAGETRHYLDWFYGINLSRALMNAIKTTGKFKIMSIGRVQGPALNLIVQRERKIQNFKSEKYWQVFINVKNSHVLELKYVKDIFDKKELDKFKDLVEKNAIADTTKKEEFLPPNPPFNLTTLQTEAYKFYGITPSRTLQIAQSLYLSGIISYPRTSSQKLPASIGYEKILKKLAQEFDVEKLIVKKKPIEGKKSDSAHPSIYPTGVVPNLSGDDKKIYELIVRRFLSLFCENAIKDNKRITAKVDDLVFSASGYEIRKKAWLEIYPSKMKENKLPDLTGEVKIINVRTEEKETQPPKRYSPASILSELEKRNLGTKATRASILETLYDRGYVRDKSIEATSLGISLIETLDKYSPIIIDEKLTRNFENQMEQIVEIKDKKKQSKEEEEVIEDAKKVITEIAKDFEKNEVKIGKELIVAELKVREKQKEENKLNICPLCKKGNLGITYSRKTRRQFVACDAYPDCKNTYSLPPNGVIKKTDKVCDECGFPKLMRLSKGRRPWVFCFNPSCPTNREWAEKREQQNKEE
jgi:DNA topoisomerase-1